MKVFPITFTESKGCGIVWVFRKKDLFYVIGNLLQSELTDP